MNKLKKKNNQILKAKIDNNNHKEISKGGINLKEKKKFKFCKLKKRDNR